MRDATNTAGAEGMTLSLRRLIDLSSECMAVLDLEGQLVVTNVAWRQALGSEPELGSAAEGQLRPEDREAWREVRSRAWGPTRS